MNSYFNALERPDASAVFNSVFVRDAIQCRLCLCGNSVFAIAAWTMLEKPYRIKVKYGLAER